MPLILTRDVHETFQAEIETRPRRWAFCPRRDVLDPRWDWDRDIMVKAIRHHKIWISSTGVKHLKMT